MPKRNHAAISGYTFASFEKTLRAMRTHKVAGDWRRDRVIHVKYKKCTIVWSKKNDDNFDTLPFSITTLMPVGMSNVMEKNQTASGRNWESVPKTVRDHFNLTKNSDYDPNKFSVCFLLRYALYLSDRM